MSETESIESNAEPAGSIAETLIVPLIAVLVLAIYFQSTGFDFIDVDDNLYVYRNPAVLSGLNWESFNAHSTLFIRELAPHDLAVAHVGHSTVRANPGSHHAVNVFCICSIRSWFLAFSAALRASFGRVRPWRSYSQFTRPTSNR